MPKIEDLESKSLLMCNVCLSWITLQINDKPFHGNHIAIDDICTSLKSFKAKDRDLKMHDMITE